MSLWSFAAVAERLSFTVSGSTGAQSVASGLPFRCYGLVIEYSGSQTDEVISVQSADGNTTYFQHTMAAQQVIVIDIPWEADRGMRVVVTGDDLSNSHVIVFRANPGA